ncbi:MAG TPA: hypothetical protein VNR88_04190 [Hyphomicrobium sp.]|nr:hypothetical protein [Hyphomicrobium sp.]
MSDTLRASPQSLQRAEEDSLQNFLTSLVPFDDLDLAAVSDALKKIQQKPAAKTAKKRANASINEAVVAKYINEFRDAQTPESVSSILRRLKSDKQVKVAEAKAIANGFRGFEAKFGSKKEALDAIEARALTDIRAQNRSDRIREIF